MTLASDVAAFSSEHRCCGELDNASPEGGDRVLVTCTCGAVFNRAVEDSESEPGRRPRAGSAEAQFRLGVMYEVGLGVGQDSGEAVKWFRRAAEQGHPDAQNNLGFMYVYGRGVAQDDAEAAKWYRRAAEQGYAGAQFNLGRRYADGRGVPKDDAEAVKWLRRAAEQGFAEAQNELGCMYAWGRGVVRDDVVACLWFILATSRPRRGADFTRAVKNRARVASKLTPGQLAEALRLAAEWKPTPGGPFRQGSRGTFPLTDAR